MKNILFTALFALVSMASIMSCSSDSDSGDNTPKPSSEPKYRRSVLIYLAAQNSLGKAGAARLDSAEIAQGAMQLTNTTDNVFLLLDDAQKPRLYRLYRNGTGSSSNTLISKVYTWSTDAYTTDPATLLECLNYIKTNFESKSYGMVMWSHGDGWLPSTNVVNTLKSSASSASFGSSTLQSFGIDVGPTGDMNSDTDATKKTGPQMDISDMAKAISQSGIHLDYIFFDACLMQCVEVAYELKDVTDYIVASATSTSAYGAYYTNLISKALFQYPANDENITKIAQQYYYDAVENTSLSKYYGKVGNVISVVKTSELEALATATGTYINKVISKGTTPYLGSWKTNSSLTTKSETYYNHNIQAYALSLRYNMPDFFDMGSAMYRLLSTTDYEQWRQVADKCVLTHYASDSYVLSYPYYSTLTDPDHVLGVSMFIPETKYNSTVYSPYNTYFKSTSWYKAANWASTGW